jgi:hypothetical protein
VIDKFKQNFHSRLQSNQLSYAFYDKFVTSFAKKHQDLSLKDITLLRRKSVEGIRKGSKIARLQYQVGL